MMSRMGGKQHKEKSAPFSTTRIYSILIFADARWRRQSCGLSPSSLPAPCVQLNLLPIVFRDVRAA